MEGVCTTFGFFFFLLSACSGENQSEGRKLFLVQIFHSDEQRRLVQKGTSCRENIPVQGREESSEAN